MSAGAIWAMLAVFLVGQGQIVRHPGQRSLGDKLFDAVSSSNLAQVKRLVKLGANPNGTYANGWPMISRAVEVADAKGGYSVLQFLIAAGANVNAIQRDQGWTPLHMAISHSKRVIELLIARGARLEAQMPGVGTPLHYAARSGDVAAAQVLLDHKANIEARSAPDAPPETLDQYLKRFPKELCSQMTTEFTDFLKRSRETQEHNRQVMEEIGGEPGYDQVGQTPLIQAAASMRDNLEMVRLLLDRGANIQATDSIGRTPLHEAAQAGSATLAEFLLRRGAKVDARSKNGLTPLHLAVRLSAFGYTSVESVETLLKNGADPNAVTGTGLTPLMMQQKELLKWTERIRQSPGTQAERNRYLVGIDQQSKAVADLLKKYGGKGGFR